MRFLNRIIFAWARLLPLWLAALTFLPSHAQAQVFVNCTSYGYTSFTLNMPASIAVPRDLPNGTLLTAWSSTPSADYFNCDVSNASQGIHVYPAGIATINRTAYTVPYQGASIGVFPTTLPGVGIALAVRPHIGCYWAAITTAAYSFGCVSSPGNTNMSFGAQMFAALVKTGDITPGTLSGMVATLRLWHTLPDVVSYNITPVVITVLTCQTPSKTVQMGTHGISEFPAVGSLSVRPASFTLDLNNCPSGRPDPGLSTGQINSIQYRFDPASGTVPGFANVAALSGNPSAGGIGIQLFDNAGAVVPLATNINLAGFRPGVASSYSVPMTARYYRTGAMTAGPANTSMTVTILYQ